MTWKRIIQIDYKHDIRKFVRFLNTTWLPVPGGQLNTRDGTIFARLEGLAARLDHLVQSGQLRSISQAQTQRVISIGPPYNNATAGERTGNVRLLVCAIIDYYIDALLYIIVISYSILRYSYYYVFPAS